MAKDPAFLFYPNDYMGGTLGMTLEEKGAYMELLILQFNKGHFTIEQAKKLLNGSFERLWEVVKEKFIEDETRGFFNERLEQEKNKRKNFNNKQKEKGSKGGRPKKNPNETQIKPVGYENDNPNKSLLENENENTNDNASFEKSEKLLMPALYKIFVEKNSGYLKSEHEDFTALKIILKYLCELLGEDINRIFNNTAAHHALKLRWGEIVTFIVKDSFYQSFDLPGIQRNFRAIILKQKNGNSQTFKPKNSKNAGTYELLANFKNTVGAGGRQ
jgi:uncharacterized protein YdaU (DUF1376 family)